MNQILEGKNGIFTKTVDWTDRQVIRMYLISQFIFLFPFFIADMVMVNQQFSECLLANFACPNVFRCDNPVYTIFTLGQWLGVDGYFKLALFSAVLFITVLDTQLTSKNLAALCGNLIRFFYIFDFGWTVTGSALFWGSFMGFPGKTYTFCDAPYKGYIFFLLIFSYIIIPINLMIGSIRPNPRLRIQISQVGPAFEQTTRRNTQLMNKQFTASNAIQTGQNTSI